LRNVFDLSKTNIATLSFQRLFLEKVFKKLLWAKEATEMVRS